MGMLDVNLFRISEIVTVNLFGVAEALLDANCAAKNVSLFDNNYLSAYFYKQTRNNKGSCWKSYESIRKNLERPPWGYWIKENKIIKFNFKEITDAVIYTYAIEVVSP